MFAVFISFSSCTKIAQECFSCNNEINEFVITNKEVLSNINREQILEYRADYQRAIFRSLNAEMRLALWKDKFTALKQLDWTAKEVDLLKQIEATLTLNIFKEDYLSNEEFKVNLEMKFNSWIKYCSTELHWTDGRIYSLLGTLENQINDKNVLDDFHININHLKNSDEAPGSGTCECNSSSDYCSGLIGSGGSLGHCATGTHCSTTTLGCGTLWTFSCNGMCELGPAPDSNDN